MRVFLLVAALLGCGMGAVLIQTLGWVTMLPTQLVETGSVIEAVENTFSGDHPCEFCKAAQRLRSVAQESPSDQEPMPSGAAAWGKDFLSSVLKTVPIIRPAETFLSQGPAVSPWWTSVTLDLESPPPQGC